MRGAIPPLPQYTFMVWCLVKHRDNFIFTSTFNFILLEDGNYNVDREVERTSTMRFRPESRSAALDTDCRNLRHEL